MIEIIVIDHLEVFAEIPIALLFVQTRIIALLEILESEKRILYDEFSSHIQIGNLTDLKNIGLIRRKASEIFEIVVVQIVG